MTYADISEDSEAYVRISSVDLNQKSFVGGPRMGTMKGTKLSLWTLDSGSLDNWNLVCAFAGSAEYATDHWRFTVGTSFATGNLDSNETYYLGLDGVW